MTRISVHISTPTKTNKVVAMGAGDAIVLHMNAGNGETSYATNSLAQRTVIQKAQHIIEETLRKMCNENKCLPKCLRIADLGCSSGPNTLLVVSNIINTIHQFWQHKEVGEIQVCLNDLPENDFNTIFRLLPAFYEKLNFNIGDTNFGPLFVSGVPGSFYGRLFPSNTLHFVHSSYSIHWLSQVPKMLENKGNIYLGKSSPPRAHEAYLMQFESDFSTFLGSRSGEVVRGGYMVLTLIGRNFADPTCDGCCSLMGLLSKSLLELASEGLIKESDIDSFNLPYYTPYEDEVKAIVEKQGSFDVERLEVFDINWDGHDDVEDKYKSGNDVALIIRAVSESLFVSHFGDAIIDNLFAKYAKNLTEHLLKEKGKTYNITISLRKK